MRKVWFIILMMIVQPLSLLPMVLQVSAATIDETVIYPTSLCVDNGTIVSGSLDDLRVADQSGVKIIETTGSFESSPLVAPFATEDDLDKWYAYGDVVASLTLTTTEVYDGSYALQLISSSTGYMYLVFDNGTSNQWGFDVIYMDVMNFTLMADNTRFVLDEVRLYSTSEKYWYYLPDVRLSSSYQVIEIYQSVFTPVGGIAETDLINWMEFKFEVKSGGVGKSVYFDSGGFYGPSTNQTLREIDGYIKFENIPVAYSNYVINVSARQYINSTYLDDFFTENASKWTGNNISVYEDTTNKHLGDKSIKFVFNGTSDATFIFDNGTGRNMQANFSLWDAHTYTLWGNDSFTLSYIRWYTDSDNYFYTILDKTYTTIQTDYFIPIGLYYEYGAPDKANISWIEFGINSTENSAPLTIWLDALELSTSETVEFYIVCGSMNESFITRCSHGDEIWNHMECSVTKSYLDAAGYTVIVYFNDTLEWYDNFNTVIEIDYAYINAWVELGTSGGGGGSYTHSTTTSTSVITSTTTVSQPDDWSRFVLFSTIVMAIAFYLIMNNSSSSRRRYRRRR